MGATGAEELREEILRKKAERRVGDTLRGKWHLDSLIGVGGMGAVYEATHRNGLRGAVKLLHTERAADEIVRKRFLREGYIANKVEHPGAVRILDDDEADGTVFLVMELLDGMSLEARALREGGALSPRDTMLMMDQALDTLAVAHEKGIVHRDIKPANLFVTRSGMVKILDYGIARVNEPDEEGRSSTQMGVGMGTPAFMAPEQARGRWKEVDARSDVWSLGATMFWLLTGTTVHDEGTIPELVAATFLLQARPVRSVSPELSRTLAAVVDRALMLDKGERWPDARAMQDALRVAYQHIHGSSLPSFHPVLTASDPSIRASRPDPSQPRIDLHGSTPATSSITPPSEAFGPPPDHGSRRRAFALGVTGIAAAALAIAIVARSHPPPDRVIGGAPANAAIVPSDRTGPSPSPSDTAPAASTPAPISPRAVEPVAPATASSPPSAPRVSPPPNVPAPIPSAPTVTVGKPHPKPPPSALPPASVKRPQMKPEDGIF